MGPFDFNAERNTHWAVQWHAVIYFQECDPLVIGQDFFCDTRTEELLIPVVRLFYVASTSIYICIAGV